MSNEHDHQEEIVHQIFTDYISRPEFKRLLLDIDITLTDKHSKVLSVLSLFPKEGKSFVITTLAYGTARLLGKKVLIVDCVNHYREDSLLAAILPHSTYPDSEQGQIDVVTAQSLTGIDSKHADFKLRSALASLAPSYDRVFIDTGAIHSSSALDIDPIIVAKQSGATIIVSSPYSLHRNSVLELRDQIHTSGVSVIGTVYSERI